MSKTALERTIERIAKDAPEDTESQGDDLFGDLSGVPENPEAKADAKPKRAVGKARAKAVTKAVSAVEGSTGGAPVGDDLDPNEADTPDSADGLPVDLEEALGEGGPVPLNPQMQPITRRSGQPYFPRMLTNELTDVEVFRKCREEALNSLLYGYPGTGKTAALEAAFGDELVTIEGNGDTEVRDLIGGYVQKIGSPELHEAERLGVTVLTEGQAYALAASGDLAGKQVVVTGTPADPNLAERVQGAGATLEAFASAKSDYLIAAGASVEKYFEWEDGPLTIAMKNGWVLLVDDATLIAPQVISKVYPAMDGRGVIRLEQKMGGEEVVAQEGFMIVAAHNPGAPMAILSEALASRFGLHVEVSSDFKLARRLGVDGRIINVAETMRAARFNDQVSWAPEMRELLNFQRVERLFGDQVAARNLLASAPEDARDELRQALKTTFGDIGPLGMHG